MRHAGEADALLSLKITHKQKTKKRIKYEMKSIKRVVDINWTEQRISVDDTLNNRSDSREN